MRHPLVCTAVVTLSACGLTNAPDPNVLHVTNVSYNEIECGAASCDGVLSFRLVDPSGAGRSGLVMIDSHGFKSLMGVWTNADGWRQMAWNVAMADRPYTITVCPEGVASESKRCGSTSTH